MGRRKKTGLNIHGFLLLDKPQGCSSNAALQQVKRAINANKAGHTGTLDPLATGMLPICLGEATKLCPYLLTADKAYLTVAHLGVTTDTGDADGETTATASVSDSIDLDHIQASVKKFVGTIMQVPPMYSALKVGGQRLYKLAREGRTVERAARQVEIYAIEVVDFESPFLTLQIKCSKGTYIRTLIEDLGVSLGCGAHVTSLRRLWVSPFESEPMVSVNCFTAASAGVVPVDNNLLPMDFPLYHLPRTDLDQALSARFCSGQPVPLTQVESAGLGTSQGSELWRVYSPDNILGLGKNDGVEIRPSRVFNFG